MTKKDWKIFAAGLVAALLYAIIVPAFGFPYFVTALFIVMPALYNDTVTAIVSGLPILLWGAAVYYGYKMFFSWRKLGGPSLRTKLTQSLIFGAGAFCLYLLYLLAVALFVHPQIG